jgi:hypothetical protein
MTNIKKYSKIIEGILTDIEHIPWLNGKGLDGLVLNDADELKRIFPEDDRYYAPAISIPLTAQYGFIVYTSLPKDAKKHLEKMRAYYCWHCDTVIIGGPKDPKIVILQSSEHPNEKKLLYFCSKKKKYLPYPDLNGERPSGVIS